MQRDGPGLFLRDILSDPAEPDIVATARLVAKARADVLVLSGIDYDHGLVALGAFRDLIKVHGADYAHPFALPPNTGMATGLDLDQNGWKGDARDAQGYGAYSGQGGLAVLSQFPVSVVQDFSGYLWRDLPGSLIADDDPARDTQRLSSNAHWVLEVALPDAEPLTLLTFHATPPVFDGPEDRNGRRNHDEAAFWLHWLAGGLSGETADPGRLVLLGDANLDPVDGDGRAEAITALLNHPLLQDPAPKSPFGAELAQADGGANRYHGGDPMLDTANWDDAPGGPGNLRVDYVLPSRDWEVAGSGVLWGSGDGDADLRPRHGLVWADLVTDR